MIKRQIPIYAVLAILLLVGCSSQGSDTLPPEPSATPLVTVAAPTAPSPTATPISAAEPTEETQTITVPVAAPPNPDGTMDPGEWDGAARSGFADGSEMLLKCYKGNLYMGIRASGSEMIAGNVFLNRGDGVAILHTSAALGTAHYQKSNAGWEQMQDFEWRCRRTDDGEAAQAERERFWDAESWLAANSRKGTANELEYRIALHEDEDELRLAASFLRTSDTNKKIGWPANVIDDVITPTPGGLPKQLSLATDAWYRLDLSLCDGE